MIRFYIGSQQDAVCAKLKLYVQRVDKEISPPMVMTVSRLGLSSSWLESDATYNNFMPPSIDEVGSSVNIDKGQEHSWIEFDVTSLVQGATNGEVSLILQATHPDEGALVFFSPREKFSKTPYLELHMHSCPE